VPHPLGFKGADFDFASLRMRVQRHPLVRIYGRRDLHFITFSCYRRRPFLGSVRSRNRFVKILDEVRSRHRFALIGYVVMPEHVHLLITEPPKGNPSKVLQVLKQKVSRSLRAQRASSGKQMRLAFASEASDSPAFWQRRFYDFNVWSEKKLREKLDYMHRNPVERGLIKHPKDWPWSSWSHYALEERGLIRIDVLEASGDRRKTEATSKSAPLKPKGAAPDRTPALRFHSCDHSSFPWHAPKSCSATIGG
jgi:putative transposase